MNELLVLLLPLAAFSGWWIARSDNKSADEQKGDDYFKGLSYLLEDETDKAIDIFFRIAHLDNATIENQMTLGNLFRHRGEIDRALHIHTSLKDKADPNSETGQKLNLALAADYYAAGIMNHAEAHYQTVRESGYPDMRDIARRRLISLYAEQSFWEQAIEVAEELDPFARDAIQQQVAHFHCEIATRQLAEENPDEKAVAKRLLKALSCDSKCVRASVKLGRLSLHQNNTIAAIGYFLQIEQQNPAFIPEVLDDFEVCYQALNQIHEWKIELKRLAKKTNNPMVVLRLNKLIAETEGHEAATSFLRQRLSEKPTLLVLQAFLRLSDEPEQGSPTVSLLNESINKLLGYTLKYRCRECGFRGNQLNWQCPGCKNWGSFTPVSDVSLKEDIH